MGDRITELEQANVRLAAEVGSLRAENAGLAAECERLAGLACRHPAGAVDGGHCHACGQDVD